MGCSSSWVTKSWARGSAVGRLARLSPCVIASTGVGPWALLLRAGISVLAGSNREPDDGPVSVQVVDGCLEQGSGVRWVVDLDVAPAAELAPIVDCRAPLVASRVGLRRGGARGL